MTAANSNADDRAVVRNAVAQYGGLVVSVGLGLVLTPVLLRNLGETAFGAWVVVLALTAYVGVGELGLGTATVRRVAAELARGDDDAVARVASTSLALYLGTAVSGLALLAAATTVTGLLLDVPAELVSDARIALILVGGSAAVSFLFTVYPAVLIGAGRSDLLTAAGVATGLVSGLAQIGTVLLTDDLRALAAVSAVLAIGAVLVVRAVARRQHPRLTIRLRLADRQMARELLSSSWRNGVITISALAAYNADVLIVGAFLSAGAVAAYAVAVRASGLLSTLTFRLSEVLVPTYSHYDAGGDDRRIYRMYVEATLASWAVALPGCAVLVAFGGPLLEAWLGNVPDGSADVLLLLALAVAVAVPGGTAFFLLSGIDRLGFMVKASVVAGISSAGLGIALTPTLGVTGPAVATLAVRTVLDLLVLPAHVCAALGVSARSWWGEVVPVVLPPALVTTGLTLGIRFLIDPREPLALAVVSITIAASFIATFLAAAGSERRTRYLAMRPRGRTGR